jgi:thioredoxin reductase
MDAISVIWVVTFLVLVFSILGAWKRRIDRQADTATGEELAEAQALGANEPLTQHPIIDIYRCIGCGCCATACPEEGVIGLVEGKARLVNASHCVGHGLCEAACPVGAIEVGLGGIADRDDIPLLNSDGETSLPGVFICGELSGIGLIRNAITQGVAAVEAIRKRPRADEGLDVLIVGSGPSGIAATLRAHELGLNYMTIEQDGLGGAVRKYPRNKMTLTQPVHLPVYGKMNRTQYSKEELIELWQGVLSSEGIAVNEGVRLEGLERRGDGRLLARTSMGDIVANHCVLALGRRGTPRKLGISGEESERVLYQLMDAADYTGLQLLVVGGGDSAIEAALGLAAQPGNRVVLSYRRSGFFRIKQRNRERIAAAIQDGSIEVAFNSVVERIDPGSVRLVLNTDEGMPCGSRELDAAFVFIFAGGIPPYPLLKGMGIQFGGNASGQEGER